MQITDFLILYPSQLNIYEGSIDSSSQTENNNTYVIAKFGFDRYKFYF